MYKLDTFFITRSVVRPPLTNGWYYVVVLCCVWFPVILGLDAHDACRLGWFSWPVYGVTTHK